MAKTKKQSRRTRKRSSVAGKILPPLDVRSASSLKDLEKRIRSGPLTMILVYADWCGHCHQMMPHWDRAANTSGRSIQAVKVNETMLGQVNSTVNQSINRKAQPIEVEGYPSILLVDNQGNKVTDIEPVKDAKVLSKAMTQSGPLAEEAGLASTEEAGLSKEAGLSHGAPNVARNIAPNASVEPASIVPSYPRNESVLQAEEAAENEEAVPLSAQHIAEADANASSLYATSPPTEKERKGVLVSNSLSLTPANKLRGGGVSSCSGGLKHSGGTGGLYGALSHSAYTLAAPAVLLGMAGYVMKRRSTRKGKGRRVSKTRKGKGKGKGKGKSKGNASRR